MTDPCKCHEPATPGHRCWATREAELEGLRRVAEAARSLHRAYQPALGSFAMNDCAEQMRLALIDLDALSALPAGEGVDVESPKPRRRCPVKCGCLCHVTQGGVHDHPGRPCPGKFNSTASVVADEAAVSADVAVGAKAKTDRRVQRIIDCVRRWVEQIGCTAPEAVEWRIGQIAADVDRLITDEAKPAGDTIRQCAVSLEVEPGRDWFYCVLREGHAGNHQGKEDGSPFEWSASDPRSSDHEHPTPPAASEGPLCSDHDGCPGADECMSCAWVQSVNEEVARRLSAAQPPAASEGQGYPRTKWGVGADGLARPMNEGERNQPPAASDEERAREWWGEIHKWDMPDLARRIAAVRAEATAAERERCAGICEGTMPIMQGCGSTNPGDPGRTWSEPNPYAAACAARIRQRPAGDR